ncbi:MAG: NIPSNAP family protein [Rhodobacteraceae bacterium]|nr:NIPSNAP family protein [Paracoccaceae bacterium]
MATVEILNYVLQPGTAMAFHRVMTQVSVPLHAAHGLDVVAFGPSAEPDRYLLIRAFDDAAARSERLAAFYAHPDWRRGPREAIIAAIDTAIPVVCEMGPAQVDALRHTRF